MVVTWVGVPLVLFACDSCAIAALVIGIVRDDLPLPLGISYGFTGFAGGVGNWVVVGGTYLDLLESRERCPVLIRILTT